MSLFLLTFRKEVSVSVEAESEELLRKAAEDACDDLDYEWNVGDWDFSIENNSNQIEWLIKNGKLPTSYKPECKLIDGEILNYEDCLEKT